jgi:hypothetical protein
MKNKIGNMALVIAISAGLIFSDSLLAQNSDKYLPDKPGTWKIVNRENNGLAATELAAFDKNLTAVAEWFHKNNFVLASPIGFDMKVDFRKPNYEQYKKYACNYGYQAEINFTFQVFLNQSVKQTDWTFESFDWQLDINKTTSGHGINFTGYEGYKVQIDDPKLEAPLDNAVLRLSELFTVFPAEKEIAPGIILYGEGNLVISNPARPPCWIPVKVKEVMDLKLAYYKLRPDDKLMYEYFKAAYDKMSPEELSARASAGSEDGILDVNGTNQGLPIMRFNKDYWDRSLPPSAIQFITFYYQPPDENKMQEYMQNNGHPDYAQKLMDAINLSQLGSLIQKK